MGSIWSRPEVKSGNFTVIRDERKLVFSDINESTITVLDSDTVEITDTELTGTLALLHEVDTKNILIKWDDTFRVDINSVRTYIAEDSAWVESNAISVSGEAVIIITEDNDITHRFTFDLSGTCDSDSSCQRFVSGCFDQVPLKVGENIVGDIKLCTDGVEIRKNVLSADGSISKQPL